jgi:hypothetical protein
MSYWCIVAKKLPKGSYELYDPKLYDDPEKAEVAIDELRRKCPGYQFHLATVDWKL